MKTIILHRKRFIILFATLLTCVVSSCSLVEQEPNDYLPPEYLLISGATSVTANSIKDYYTFYLDDAVYNWTVPAGATITEGQGTSHIKVKFGTSGGKITVEAKGMTASKEVVII